MTKHKFAIMMQYRSAKLASLSKKANIDRRIYICKDVYVCMYVYIHTLGVKAVAGGGGDDDQITDT